MPSGDNAAAHRYNDRVHDAIMRLKEQPIKGVNWRAVFGLLAAGTAGLIASSLSSLLASHEPSWVAFAWPLLSISAAAAALLYRHVPALWVVQRHGSKRRT